MGGAYDPYEKYGLKRVINAATSLTLLGGSMPHPDVFKAMEDASKAFVSIPVLQQWAGQRIAEAFGAAAGLPPAGAGHRPRRTGVAHQAAQPHRAGSA